MCTCKCCEAVMALREVIVQYGAESDDKNTLRTQHEMVVRFLEHNVNFDTLMLLNCNSESFPGLGGTD